MLKKSTLPAALSRHPLDLALIALVGILYVPLLWHWVDGWLNKSISLQHEYFSHGLLGLPFAAYLAWGFRHKWQQLPDRCHWLGPLLLGLGLSGYLSGLGDWANLSFPLVLAGLCLSLKGLAGFKLQSFPLLLVLFATPNQIPYLIEPYVLPLQRFIAAIAGFILLQFGVDVRVQQIYLFVNDQLVEVAPHCAGLKMLFTSLYVGLMLIYWVGLYPSRLRTSLFVVGIVGLSIAGNVLRNTMLTFFHGYQFNDAFHWLHESWGGEVYSAITLVLILYLARWIQSHVPASLSAFEIRNNQSV